MDRGKKKKNWDLSNVKFASSLHCFAENIITSMSALQPASTAAPAAFNVYQCKYIIIPAEDMWTECISNSLEGSWVSRFDI